MRHKIETIRILLVLNLVFCTVVFSAQKDEYRTFSRVALDSVLKECQGELHDDLKTMFVQNGSLVSDTPLWENKSFAGISVAFPEKNQSRAWFHKRGYTILQQLQALTPTLIEEKWKTVESKKSIISVEHKYKNVIVNYFLHHLMAMRFAHRAGKANIDSQEDLRYAFIYEAMALGYLVDAFSSTHILIDYKILPILQYFNYRKAREFYRTKGAYVINSKGDVWHTFGDKLMLWYEPTYRFTLDACITSLRELLLVFYATVDPDSLPLCMETFQNSLEETFSAADWLHARPGVEYYANLKMPSLLCLPMPISASWSKKSEDVDKHGIHRRIHYPQLREPGFHDPDLEGIDTKFLLSLNSIPAWLIFEEFRKSPHPDSTREIIKENPKFASVRFIQQRSFPPSYVGLVIHGAWGATFNGKRKSTMMIGLGAGLFDDFLFLHNVSADMHYIEICNSINCEFLTATLGTSIPFALPQPLNVVKSIRIEAGLAWQKDEDLDIFHNQSAGGIEFATLPLGLMYVGITPRIMAYRIYTGSAYHGVYFQIAVH